MTTTLTVLSWQRVVLFRDGALEQVLGPGRHRIRQPGRTTSLTVDLRPVLWPVPGQDVLTADSLSVRISVHAEVAVTDPAAYVTVARSPHELFHPAIQLALREAALARTLEQLLADRTEVNAALRAAADRVAQRLGIQVNEVAVRDIMLPGDVRKAAADVVLARQRGLAELERARSEAAALRSLANTARLLADNPDLLRLRTLQAAESPGTTVVLTAQ